MGLSVFLLLMLPGVARASDEAPVRAVRLSYLQGSVRVLPADNAGGDPAQLNMPLTEGERVATGDDGEAEVEFEDGSLLRLPPQSTVVLSRLAVTADGSSETRVGLLKGLVYAGLRVLPRSSYRVDAGADVVTPLANAVIRVTLDQPPAEVAVMEGTAHVERAGVYQVDVSAGEALRGDLAGSGRYFLSQRIEHNSWDDWNEEREQVAANDLAARTSARDAYAGDQGFGWSDLDANGTWYDTGQGPVWQPFEAGVSGFDPYGFGSWVYASGPGYVWSSGYRWGWTPFRCGSWNYWGDFGWGWRPAGNCGSAPWGGVPVHPGRVNRINLSSVPPGYKRPLPPVPGGPVRVHPIVRVGTPPGPLTDRGRAYEAREIAGKTALPLRVVGSSYTPRGGSAVGSSLRRDFPVDAATRQPVLGAIRVTVERRSEGGGGSGALAGGNRGAAAGEIVTRPSYAGRRGAGRDGQETANPVPGTMNSLPAVVNQVPAPLHGEPAVINTVPRLPLNDRSGAVLPPGQRPTPVTPVRVVPTAPVRIVPTAPVRVVPTASAPTRSAPPPAPATTTVTPKK